MGNRLSSLGVSPYSYNTSNELTSLPGTTYTYDNNGNTATKVVSGATTSYTWDYENRLAQVTLPGTGGTVTFKYDPFGRRVQKSFTVGSTTTTTNYLYDGANVLEEVNNAGTLQARYTHSSGIDEPLAEKRGTTASYYEADGLGSVTSLSNTSGALANTYTYDAYGKLTASTGTVVNPFRFTGREFDGETGIYEYRARYYDAPTGRFATEDPIGFRSDVNFYRYVKNNPSLYYDPAGLDAYDWFKKFRRWGNRSKCFVQYYYCLSHLSDTRDSLDGMSGDAILNTADAMHNQGSLSNQRLSCALRQDQNCRDALENCIKLGLTNPFPPPWWFSDLINAVGGPKPKAPSSDPNAKEP